MRALLASRTGIEHSLFQATTNVSLAHTLQGTQETQDTGSYDYSDASSIARFPAFHFSLHGVTALSSLSGRVKSEGHGGQKVNVLTTILEVEGPDVIRLKRGVDAGKEVGILKLILGEDDGGVCKLTAWREVAEAWGGSDPDPSAPGIKKGDVVLLESQFFSSSHCAFRHLPVNHIHSIHRTRCSPFEDLTLMDILEFL